MSSMDKLLRHSSEELPKDHAHKQAVQLNGSAYSLESFSSEQLLKTIEAVNSIDSIASKEDPDVDQDSNPIHIRNDNINVSIRSAPKFTDLSRSICVSDKNRDHEHSTKHMTAGTLCNKSPVIKSSSFRALQRKNETKPSSNMTKENETHMKSQPSNEINNHRAEDRRETYLSVLKIGEMEVSPENTYLGESIEQYKLHGCTDSQDEVLMQKLSRISDISLDEREMMEGTTDLDQTSVISLDSAIDETEMSHVMLSDTNSTGWKLDRRESGHLFWRRDSSSLNGIDPKSRVKFRYDVEVCEFESRSSETEDLAEEYEDYEEGGDEIGFLCSAEGAHEQVSETSDTCSEEQESQNSVAIASAVAIVVVIVAVVYGWISSHTTV